MKNQIDDDGAANLIELYSPVLSSIAPQNRYEAHFQLGLLAWRVDDVDTLRHHLRAAAGDWLTLAESMPADSRPNMGPTATALPVLMTAIFGDDAQRERLARLPRNLYTDPMCPDVAQALDEVRAYFAGSELDAAAWGEILRNNDGANAFFSLFVRYLASGMRAIALRNELAAGRALEGIVQHHAWLAQEGDWTMLAEGLLSFWGLALAAVARAEGLRLPESPMEEYRLAYVPDLDPAVRHAPRTQVVDTDFLPLHSAEAARVLAVRFAKMTGIDVSKDQERLTRLASAHADAANELKSGSSSLQQLPFFALNEGRPLGIAITFHADRRFDIAKMSMGF